MPADELNPKSAEVDLAYLKRLSDQLNTRTPGSFNWNYTVDVTLKALLALEIGRLQNDPPHNT